ncbi:hypothetical protein jhhlp_003789 [Lomentospora prolificans]|uniref:AB hydrolase-1 domain-containing protein n=1 Tax=Lomentospora prolificans TaxID=41688 RepID=A0A2N3N9R3_9PEZI|nr:hypothetical protein jhhlp_003789 [Lomentospora prolificans]
MPFPFIGRLHLTEYLALVGSFCLVALEALIRVWTLALPKSPNGINVCYAIPPVPPHRAAVNHIPAISTSVRDTSDFVDLCRLFGYEAEEHISPTKDGYLLGLHRLAWRKGEEGKAVNAGPNSLKKRVVYLHHGLLMNSEVWVSLTDAERSLPLVLVERGFDVWLGNNRGNKYSKKSLRSSPSSLEFWNFSMDEFALHDIPDSISYILDTTSSDSLSYIGFSQGTAQAFATLSIHPKLNNKINVFIALAPAMSPAGLSNGIVDALVKASPQVIYLLFGRRSILSSATMWQSILYPPLFVRLIDISLNFLFGWKTKNISVSQKLAAYSHLYSYTSTKSVVHWFQIIRNRSFQMYDDDRPGISLNAQNKHTKVARYPTRNIKTPIVLVYGGSDSLVDIKVMLKELPPQTVATEIPHYEHLDFLWGRDIDRQVFPHVFDALDSFTDAAHSKEEYARYRIVRQESLFSSKFQRTRDASDVTDSEETIGPLGNLPNSNHTHPYNQRHWAREQASNIPPPGEVPRLRTPLGALSSSDEGGLSSPEKPETPSPARATEQDYRRELFGDNELESPASRLARVASARRGSGASILSLNNMEGGRGIQIGAGKAAGGVVTRSRAEATGVNTSQMSMERSPRKQK